MPYDLPRIPLPTDASSAELARLPAAIRRQALFSAKLNSLGPLTQIGADIKRILDGSRSMSEARRDIRQALAEAGYQPPAGSEGGILDHRSRTRLDLILEQNVRASRGFGKWAADMHPDTLDLWPAQELVRVMSRKVPRGDWKERWRAAGGQLPGGRMIALKTSPVWTNLSRFGQPFPPYDYGSGMGVIDIDRDEAERLGLIAPAETLTPDPIPFPDMAEARLPDIDSMPALRSAILKAFGDSASFKDGTLSLAPARTLPVPGNAASLDLGSLADRTVTPPPAYVPPSEARSLIASGAAVAGVPGQPLARIDPNVERHWRDKGYSQTAIDSRLKHIRQALATLQDPQEVWEHKNSRWYLREFDPSVDGQIRRVLVQTEHDGRVITWIPTSSKPRYFDKKRTGVLSVKEGA